MVEAMPMSKYILDEQRRVRPTRDLRGWAEFMDDIEKRRVGWTRIGERTVSTMFLGLDHGLGRGLPVVWETMVFDERRKASDQRRCAGTWEQAEAQHEEVCRELRAKQPETSDPTSRDDFSG
jgi:hypothetical protein